MIDEELYELAAAELNSDKRIPRLWARACALASDDHDEARFLYTNLRVEELLAARESPDQPPGTDSGDSPESDHSTASQTRTDGDTAVPLTPPQAQYTDAPPDDPFDNLRLEPLDDGDTGGDAPLASSRVGTDSSPAPNALSADDVQNYSADDESRPASVRTEQRLDLSNADVQLDPSGVMQINDALPGTVSAIDGQTVGDQHNETLDVEPPDADSQANAANDTAKISPDELSWLDEEIRAEREAAERESRRVAMETDSLAEDLRRQAEEFERESVDTNQFTATSPDTEADDITASGAAAAVAGVATAGVATIGAATAEAETIGTATTADHGSKRDNVTPDTASQGTAGDQDDVTTQPEPDDFSELRVGGRKTYLVYSHFAGNSRAVKLGGSWPALFFTFPWLVSRGMLGTAVLYALLWIVLLSTLLWTGFAWLDAGANATTAIKWWAAGFAALAAIALLYIPFRNANSWYARKLEQRGYEFQEDVGANSPGQAVKRFLDYLD